MGFFQILNLKKRQLPIFFMVEKGKKWVIGVFLSLKFWKKPIWREMAHSGQRQIDIYVFSVIKKVKLQKNLGKHYIYLFFYFFVNIDWTEILIVNMNFIYL